MPTTRHPRHGSLQYWPRKRAQRQHARVRSWGTAKQGIQGFAGFKAGMTHIVVTDNRKNSITKGQDITVPVTIIECPPLTIAGIRLYKDAEKGYGTAAATEIHKKAGKFTQRRTNWKAHKKTDTNPDDYTHATIIAHSQPDKTGIGQKAPHIFEIGFDGTVQEALDFFTQHDELKPEDVFKAGEFLDTHAVTKGKGTQGVVKRFGVSLRSHKSEKSVRKAVIAPEGYGKVQYTAPMAGKMGYHLRTEYNKQLMSIVTPEQVKISGGIPHYGDVKNVALLVRGSIPGPKKRLITLSHATRPDPKRSVQEMALVHVATRSQQGNI